MKLARQPFVLLVSLFLCTYSTALAAPPADFQISTLVSSGLSTPTAFDIAPDGRVFILEQGGAVRIYKNGALLPTPFITLPVNAINDRGLLGIAFDHDFVTTHYVYFYYVGTDFHDHVVRYDASSDVAAGSPAFIYDNPFESTIEHQGGTIQFGADEKLYISIGDNGYPPNAQDVSNPFGKILRVNEDGSIPSDNPYVGQAGKLPEIWASGLRNPFRFQFDHSSGRLYAGDVGKDTWEEMNLIIKGGNYGWPLCEGTCSTAGFINPAYSYNHNGTGSSVTGGPVYHGSQFPTGYENSLFFGDYVKGFIKRIILDASGAVTSVVDFDSTVGTIVDLKTGSDGSLYYLTIFPGKLYRYTYAPSNKIPVAISSSNKIRGVEPLTVQLSSSGSYDPEDQPLAYAWDFGDGTSTTTPHPFKTYVAKGTYVVRLSVSDGAHVTQALPITIQAGTPPIIAITAPVAGSLYTAGGVVAYSAQGTDSTGASLPSSAFSAQLIFHHNTHVHPFLGTVAGSSGQFTIPKTGESSTDTWYEIQVTATDANGLSTTTSHLISPRKTSISFATVPAGLQILLDGSPVQTPASIERVVGFQSTIAVPDSQVSGGTAYGFQSWSDSGAKLHTISVPAVATQYTATLTPVPGFSGQYWNTPGAGSAPAIPTTTPTLTRTDPAIDFDWGTGSPDTSIATDHFVVRWIKTDTFAAGIYRLTAATDDGVRVYLDNTLLIDQWLDQGPTTYQTDSAIASGTHTIKLEYYENSGGAVAKFNLLQITASPPTTTPPTSNIQLMISGTPATGPYSVEAQTSFAGLDRIEFRVDGALYSTERYAPYSLFGDNNSPPIKSTLGTGSHLILASAFTSSGLVGMASTTVVEDSTLPPPATTTPPSGSVQMILAGDPASAPYSIEARTAVAAFDRIEFFVDGALYRTERYAPYSLFGDNDAPPIKSVLGDGTHTVIAKVYAGNALLDTGSITLTEGTTSPPTTTPPTSNIQLMISGTPATGPYSVEAQTSLAGLDRIEFRVDGALYSTERYAPYSLFGDNNSPPIKSTLGTGSHLILASAFTSSGLVGMASTTVVEGGGP